VVVRVAADHHDETDDRLLRLAADLQRAYADALLAGDQVAAERVVRDGIEAGLGEALIDDLVIRPSLVLVGDLWAEGRISVADEHLATAISIRVLTLQREAFRVARRRAAHRVLLAGAQGEHHVVGLEMAASVILHAGYDVRMLGADLPVAAVPAAVERHQPAVVGFTTASAATAANLPDAFDAVRRVRGEIGIVVGGQGIPQVLATRPDVAVCRHVADAIESVDALVMRAGRN
jgi:MerR family transcriptional regulator, light-induced transcriptional regulator